MLQALVNVVFCDRQDFASRTPVAFRLLHDTLATAVGGNLVL
jgi:hypothetical protein